jgi:hypothetical protein
MKSHFPARFKKLVRRILVLIAPLATPGNKPRQLELFESAFPSIPNEAEKTNRGSAAKKNKNIRPKQAYPSNLANFV